MSSICTHVEVKTNLATLVVILEHLLSSSPNKNISRNSAREDPKAIAVGKKTQCTVIQEIPQNYHGFVLGDPCGILNKKKFVNFSESSSNLAGTTFSRTWPP